MIGQNKRVLDIGCSSGTLGHTLTVKKNCEVVGIDMDSGDVQIAKKRLSAAYVANIENDQLPDIGLFDYVIFSDVIEHLVEPSKTLEKVKKLLKKDGSVIFSIPNMAHMGVRLMLLKGRFSYAKTGLLDDTHLHFYDEDKIRAVFFDAGYNIEELQHGERYIHPEILDEELEKVGLTATKTFYDLNMEKSATTYQYIGIAKPSKKAIKNTKTELAFVSPYVLSVEEQINEINAKHEELIKKLADSYEVELENLRGDRRLILQSMSWRITRPLRLLSKFVRGIINRIRYFKLILKDSRFFRMSDYKVALRDDSKYEKALNIIKPKKQGNKVAVVLHLYYAEKWPMIEKKLSLLKEQAKFDLYVSIREDASDEVTKSIKLSYPEAYILKVPNRGRDVLPFIYILSFISKLDYELILKIHSKKSLHRDDGADWFESILNDLIPDDPLLLRSIVDTFNDKEVSFVGPAEQYIPLTVNYGSNSFYLNKVMKRLFDNEKRHYIQKNPNKYGFFAGTMFWVRTSDLKQFSRNIYKATDFRSEEGLIDATLAHAIERMIVVNAEIKKTKIYTVKYRSLVKTDYQTDNIPEWSDIHNSNRTTNL